MRPRYAREVKALRENFLLRLRGRRAGSIPALRQAVVEVPTNLRLRPTMGLATLRVVMERSPGRAGPGCTSVDRQIYYYDTARTTC
jgi:hypothetical protein